MDESSILYAVLEFLSLVPFFLILGTPLWLFLFFRWLNKPVPTFEEECEQKMKELSKEEYAKWYKEEIESRRIDERQNELANQEAAERDRERQDAWERDQNDNWNYSWMNDWWDSDD